MRTVIAATLAAFCLLLAGCHNTPDVNYNDVSTLEENVTLPTSLLPGPNAQVIGPVTCAKLANNGNKYQCGFPMGYMDTAATGQTGPTIYITVSVSEDGSNYIVNS